jgi:hypothetical protein
VRDNPLTRPRRVPRALLVWAVGAGVLRLSLWAPEVCPAISNAQARAAAVAAGQWIVTNQDPDGSYLYGWNRSTGEEDTGYNLVRHGGVTMSLYQLVRAGEPDFLQPADRGLGWMLERLEPAGDGVALAEGSSAKLGAAALLAVSLAQRRLVTGSEIHDETMVSLGRFLVGQQREDGSMLNFFDLDAQRPVPEETSVFATGEALWALALLHEAFPTEGFDVAAGSTLDYLATERDLEEGFYPQPWPDQWAAYSLAEMSSWGLEQHHVDYARRLLERYAFLVRFDSQRGTGYGAVTHGPAPRGSGTGTWIEGLAVLWPLTATDPRLADAFDSTTETLACGAARLADRQVDSVEGVDPRGAGAWFYDDFTRMDDQQHAASGLVLAEPALPDPGA